MKRANLPARSETLREALALSACSAKAKPRELSLTQEKSLTRRAVLWLGQTCNLKCEFCYFIDRVADKSHPEHAFMSLAKAQQICRTVAEFYGNSCIDIQGGEPTLYRDIFELIRYCNSIGLAPTLISNALLLDDLELCRNYREAGVRDFLVSVQGLGEVHDRIVGCPGAHRRQMAALANLQQLGIPFRFNVVMSKQAVPQLPEIAELAVASGAFVVNFIAFNPFADQDGAGKRCRDNVPRYSEVKPHLTAALDLLEQAGIEANVRYFPLCMVEERHRKSVYNFQQLSYDPHEWDFGSWGWTGLIQQRTREGDVSPPIQPGTVRAIYRCKELLKRIAGSSRLTPLLHRGYGLLNRVTGSLASREAVYRKVARLHAEEHCRYCYGSACSTCRLVDICDGFHGDYAAIFGTGELEPVSGGERIDDPCHYIGRQKKSTPN